MGWDPFSKTGVIPALSEPEPSSSLPKSSQNLVALPISTMAHPRLRKKPRRDDDPFEPHYSLPSPKSSISTPNPPPTKEFSISPTILPDVVELNLGTDSEDEDTGRKFLARKLSRDPSLVKITSFTT